MLLKTLLVFIPVFICRMWYSGESGKAPSWNWKEFLPISFLYQQSPTQIFWYPVRTHFLNLVQWFTIFITASFMDKTFCQNPHQNVNFLPPLSPRTSCTPPYYPHLSCSAMLPTKNHFSVSVTLSIVASLLCFFIPHIWWRSFYICPSPTGYLHLVWHSLDPFL